VSSMVSSGMMSVAVPGEVSEFRHLAEMEGFNVTVDAPETTGGSWFIDVSLDDVPIAGIQWSEKRSGFAIDFLQHGYGETAPEMLAVDALAARAAVVEYRATLTAG
jgi:hypothetical protein